MRRLTYLGALALVLLVLVAPSARAMGMHTTATTTTVYIEDFKFSPAAITVEPGTTVTWVNRGRHPHTVTSFDGQFDSGVLWPGDSYRVTFTGHGTLGYYCAIHPFMRGSVGVGTLPVLGGTQMIGGGAGAQLMSDQPMPMPGSY